MLASSTSGSTSIVVDVSPVEGAHRPEMQWHPQLENGELTTNCDGPPHKVNGIASDPD
jgi:hypothetical protein